MCFIPGRLLIFLITDFCVLSPVLSNYVTIPVSVSVSEKRQQAFQRLFTALVPSCKLPYSLRGSRHVDNINVF